MRRLLLCCALLSLCTAAGAAQMRFGGGVQGGLAFASFVPELKDFYGLGFGAGAHADLNIGRRWAIRLNGEWHTFPSDKSKFAQNLAPHVTVNGAAANPSLFSVSGLNFNLIEITADAVGKLPTSSAFTPYAVAGLGLEMASASDLTVSYQGLGDVTSRLQQLGVISPTSSETDFAVNSGLGVNFGLGAVALTLELRYVLIFSKGNNSSYIPLMLGVAF